MSSVRHLFGNRVVGALSLRTSTWSWDIYYHDVAPNPEHHEFKFDYVPPRWALVVRAAYRRLDTRIRGDAVQNAIDDYLLNPYPIPLIKLDGPYDYFVDGKNIGRELETHGYYPTPSRPPFRDRYRLRARKLLRTWWIRLTTH